MGHKLRDNQESEVGRLMCQLGSKALRKNGGYSSRQSVVCSSPFVSKRFKSTVLHCDVGKYHRETESADKVF